MKLLAASMLSDLVRVIFLPVHVLTWLGLMPPRALVSLCVVLAMPFMRSALWLRGHRSREGVSGT